MKNIFKSKIFMGCVSVAVCLAAGTIAAHAAGEFNAESMINTMTDTVEKVAKRIVNLISVLIGLVGAIMLAWNYYRRSKGDGQSNDALASWGIGLLVAMIFLQVIKVVFLQ